MVVAPDERGALAGMLISWRLIFAFFRCVPLSAVVAGIHDGVVVARWRDFLEFRAIEGPLDRFAGSIGHHIGHRAGVLHGPHAKDLLGPVALVALGKLGTGLAHPDPVAGREVVTQA